MITSVLSILSGIGLGVEVLVGRDLLAVLTGEKGKVTMHAALPYVILLALVTAGLQFVATATTEETRILSGLVEQHAIGQVVEAATAVDLLDYERTEYHNALQRAQLAASTRPVQMVNGLTAIVGTAFGIVGIGIALIVIQPVIIALLALGFVPVWLASRKASRTPARLRRGPDRARPPAQLSLPGADPPPAGG